MRLLFSSVVCKLYVCAPTLHVLISYSLYHVFFAIIHNPPLPINPLNTLSGVSSHSYTQSVFLYLSSLLTPPAFVCVCSMCRDSKCWHQHLFPEGHPNLPENTHIHGDKTHTQNLQPSMAGSWFYIFLIYKMCATDENAQCIKPLGFSLNNCKKHVKSHLFDSSFSAQQIIICIF